MLFRAQGCPRIEAGLSKPQVMQFQELVGWGGNLPAAPRAHMLTQYSDSIPAILKRAWRPQSWELQYNGCTAGPYRTLRAYCCSVSAGLRSSASTAFQSPRSTASRSQSGTGCLPGGLGMGA